MSILFLTLVGTGLITDGGVIFFSMTATSEHEPGPRGAFFGETSLVKPMANALVKTMMPLNAQSESCNARRTFVLAQSVGWIGFATG